MKDVIRNLNNDKVGVLPTDTVYGVVGRLLSTGAVARMYAVKRRDLNKPVGTVLIADISQINELVSAENLKRASQCWPGPISVILPLDDKLHYAHKGWGGLPFRIPADQTLRDLLRKTGPLATSSANLEGQPPATTIGQARDYFGGEVDFYVDGGDLSGNKPSRIIELLPDGLEKQIRS